MPTPTEFTFTVPGRPVPKARPRFSRRGRIAFTDKKTMAAENAWRLAAMAAVPAGWDPEAEYEVECLFVYKNRRNLADVDNLCKLVDGLNPRHRRKVLLEKPFVWVDDQQIVSLKAKRIVSGDEEYSQVTIRIV